VQRERIASEPTPIERNEALRLLEELAEVQGLLERLRAGLRALVARRNARTAR
jgi:hypothetical protein